MRNLLRKSSCYLIVTLVKQVMFLPHFVGLSVCRIIQKFVYKF